MMHTEITHFETKDMVIFKAAGVGCALPARSVQSACPYHEDDHQTIPAIESCFKYPVPNYTPSRLVLKMCARYQEKMHISVVGPLHLNTYNRRDFRLLPPLLAARQHPCGLYACIIDHGELILCLQAAVLIARLRSLQDG
jgi:hypothetical protein